MKSHHHKGNMSMSRLLTFNELVASVLATARDSTNRDTIELGVIHGFGVDVAEDLAPDLMDLLSSVGGLSILVSTLERLPNLVSPALADKSLWNFVREAR
jgi:hypothetical protein